MPCLSIRGFKALRRNRIVIGLAASAIALVMPDRVHAQTFTWNQATSGGSWQSATNWLPNGTPNGIANVAIFSNISIGANTVNLSAGVTLGELRFQDVDASSMSAADTIASGQTITFNNNASPSLLNVMGMTVRNETIAAALSVANGQPFDINNNGAPGVTTLTITGAVSATTATTSLNIDGSSNTTISEPSTPISAS